MSRPQDNEGQQVDAMAQLWRTINAERSRLADDPRTSSTWFGSLWDRALVPPKHVRPMGLIAVQMSINPFELFWMFGVTLVGVFYLFGAPPPNSIQALLPPLAVKLWAANLGVGGFLASIGGLWWRRSLAFGLRLYAVGWSWVGIGTFIYAIAIIIAFPLTGAFTATINVAWAFACIMRLIQVQRFLALSRVVAEVNLSRALDGGQ